MVYFKLGLSFQRPSEFELIFAKTSFGFLVSFVPQQNE
jgi:hypothetical protein